MRRREDYESALRCFEQRDADVLLGTQMVAKGLDFPAVRLAGVIDADGPLALPDFRAAERVFQLVVQVVGRAGRRAGESLALVQSASDDLPAIRHALRMDYEAFAREELASRRRYGLPPFVRLIRFVLSDEKAARARAGAERLAEDLRRVGGRVHAELRVDPPAPCVIARRRELFRFHVLVRAPRALPPGALILAAENEKVLRPQVARCTIDVDPLDLF
jgi:primosomal protein N' (replication factor Y)